MYIRSISLDFYARNQPVTNEQLREVPLLFQNRRLLRDPIGFVKSDCND